MTSTKHAFGAFVTSKRRTSGLTQQQLAERLHVTGSTVSKWERGISYPDITLVSPLADALGVSQNELLNASDDETQRRTERDAERYRAWRMVALWTTIPTFAITLIVTFIVNLVVDGGLTSFWVVLPAVVLAFSVTAFPMLIDAMPWVGYSMAGGSLAILLAVVNRLYLGGPWFGVTLVSIGMGVAVVSTIVSLLRLPRPWPRLIPECFLLLVTLMLFAFLYGLLRVLDAETLFASRAVPITLVSLVLPWGGFLVWRLARIHWAYRVAIVTGAGMIYVRLVLVPVIAAVVGDPIVWNVDFFTWNDTTSYGNTTVLSIAGALVGAALLSAGAATQQRRSAG